MAKSRVAVLRVAPGSILQDIDRLVELALGLYFTATVFYALANQIYGTVPFLVLFQIGFLYTGLLSIVQQYAGEDPVVLNTQVASGK